MPLLIKLSSEPLHVVIDLGLECHSDHPPCSLACEPVQADPAVLTAIVRDPPNITHGVLSSSPACRRSVFRNRESTPPPSSHPSTTFGYSSMRRAGCEWPPEMAVDDDGLELLVKSMGS
jgi:hypothetical protein